MYGQNNYAGHSLTSSNVKGKKELCKGHTRQEIKQMIEREIVNIYEVEDGALFKIKKIEKR